MHLSSSQYWGAISVLVNSVAAVPSLALESRSLPSLPLTVTTVHEFAFPSWCENLAIRANGLILTTRLDKPALIQVDPSGALPAITLATWDAVAYKGALGISEVVPDVFAVNVAAPVDENFERVSGVAAVYLVNLRTLRVAANGTVLRNATVSKVTDLVGADFINGMTRLDDDHVLTGDIYNGWVYKINVWTGSYSIVISDEKMKWPVGAPGHLGVNGLNIRDCYLYWTNTAVGSLNRIQITPAGLPVGTSEVVSANLPRADDFVFRGDGTTFIAQNQFDELSVLQTGQSTAVVVAGSPTETILAGVTSGRFGRLPGEENRLYLATSGGLALPINGTILVAGKIAYVDTTGF